MDFARKLLEIKILSDNICDGGERELLTLNHKILFIIDEYGVVNPSLLISKLRIAKSNLALACKQLLTQKLISSQKDDRDKRQVHYKLTAKGVKLLDNICQNIEKQFRPDEKTKDIICCMDKINALLNRKV